jgi:hypothetical protein
MAVVYGAGVMKLLLLSNPMGLGLGVFATTAWETDLGGGVDALSGVDELVSPPWSVLLLMLVSVTAAGAGGVRDAPLRGSVSNSSNNAIFDIFS